MKRSGLCQLCSLYSSKTDLLAGAVLETKLLPTPGALIPVISPLWNVLLQMPTRLAALSFKSFLFKYFFLGAVLPELKYLIQPSSACPTPCPSFASHH